MHNETHRGEIEGRRIGPGKRIGNDAADAKAEQVLKHGRKRPRKPLNAAFSSPCNEQANSKDVT